MGWLTGYTYRKQITVSTSGVTSGSLSNFPIMIKFENDTDIGSHISNTLNGFDTRFTDSDGTTLLTYDKEYWSCSSGQATGIFWVNIPSLTGNTSSAATIYIYYGNSSVFGADSSDTWDANYVGVFHLNQTTWDYSRINNSCNVIGGVSYALDGIGYCADMETSVPASGSDSPYPSGNGARTLSAWLKIPSGHGDWPVRIGPWASGSDGQSWCIMIDNSFSGTQGLWIDTYNHTRDSGINNLDDNTWHYCVIRYNGTAWHTWVDSTAGNSYTESANTVILGSGGIVLGYDYYGKMDEVRISNIYRSDDWLKLEYHNVIDSGNRLTFGSETFNINVAISTINLSAKASSEGVITDKNVAINTISIAANANNIYAAPSIDVAINTISLSMSSASNVKISLTIPIQTISLSLSASSPAIFYGCNVPISTITLHEETEPTTVFGYKIDVPIDTISVSMEASGIKASISYPINVLNTYVDADLSDFPLLVKINNPDFGTYVRPDGHNIKFYDSTLSVELPYEREYWDGNGVARFWVKVPLITHTSGARIYIAVLDYGDATDYANPTNVWDSNYKSVFHLQALDSPQTGSSGVGTLTNYECTPTTGVEGNGAHVHYSYLKVEGDIVPGTGNCTIEVWFKTSSSIEFESWLLSQWRTSLDEYSQDSYKFYFDYSGNLHGVFVNEDGDIAGMESSINVNDLQWHQTVLVRSGETAYLYVDGIERSSAGILGTIGNANNTCWIGMKQVYGTYVWPYYFDGDVDEFRYSNNDRSAAWLKFEYHNIVDGEITLGIPLKIPTNTINIGMHASDILVGIGVPIDTISIGMRASDVDTTWLVGWGLRKKIVISATSLGLSDDLLNFPLFVKFTNDSDIGAYARSDGHDIRFTDVDGVVLLKYECESFSINSGQATGMFWVKTPKIYHNKVTEIYLYCGKSGASDGQDKTNVWDINYQGIWHFGTPSAWDMNDSSVNAINGTSSSNINAVTGIVGGAGQYDGSSSQCAICLGYNMRNELKIQNAVTLEAWIYCTGDADNNGEHLDFIVGSQYDSAGPTGVSLFYDGRTNPDGQTAPARHISFQIGNGSGWHVTQNNSVVPKNQWVHVVGTRTANQDGKIYLNGISQPITSAAWDGSVNYGGVLFNVGYESGTNRVFLGKIDEVRISNYVRSTDWINFQYHNIADDGNLLDFPITETPNSFAISVSGTIHVSGDTICLYNTTENWLTGWKHRKRIRITDNDLLLSGSLADFPVFIKLTDDGNVGAISLPSGYDIRFTDADGTTLLKYERELFSISSSLANGDFWVRVPSIHRYAGAIIYMYYGKSDADDGQDAENVWETHYKGVWHLGTPSSLSLLDSTINNNDGTNNGVTATAGKLVGAGNFNISDIQINNASVPVPTSLQIQNAITLEAWIYVNGDPPYGAQLGEIVGSQADDGCRGATIFYDIRTNPDGMTAPTHHIHFQIGSGDSFHGTNVNAAVPTSQWVHIVATRIANNDAVVFYNAVSQPLTSIAWNGTISYYHPSFGNTEFLIGLQHNASRYFNGLIDEVRISDIARSADWVTFEYSNMNDTDNHLIVDPEEILPYIATGGVVTGGTSSYNVVLFVKFSGGIHIAGDSHAQSSQIDIGGTTYIFGEAIVDVVLPYESEITVFVNGYCDTVVPDRVADVLGGMFISGDTLICIWFVTESVVSIDFNAIAFCEPGMSCLPENGMIIGGNIEISYITVNYIPFGNLYLSGETVPYGTINDIIVSGIITVNVVFKCIEALYDIPSGGVVLGGTTLVVGQWRCIVFGGIRVAGIPKVYMSSGGKFTIPLAGESVILNRTICGIGLGNLVLRLFNNSVIPSIYDTALNYVECNDPSYLPVTLESGGWVLISNGASYPVQTFNYSGLDTVHGYYVTDETGNLVLSQAFPVPIGVSVDDPLSIQLNFGIN